MADDNEESWWRSTQLLAIAVLALGSVLGFGVVAFAPAPDIANTAASARTIVVATLIVPAIVLLLIFWSSARQQRIDRQHGLFDE